MINVTKEDIEAAQVYADLYSELDAYSVDAHKRIVNSFAAHRIATIEVCERAIAALPTGCNECVMEGQEQAYRAVEALKGGNDD